MKSVSEYEGCGLRFSETSPARSHAHNITANEDRSADAGAADGGREEGEVELCTAWEGQAGP